MDVAELRHLSLTLQRRDQLRLVLEETGRKLFETLTPEDRVAVLTARYRILSKLGHQDTPEGSETAAQLMLALGDVDQRQGLTDVRSKIAEFWASETLWSEKRRTIIVWLLGYLADEHLSKYQRIAASVALQYFEKNEVEPPQREVDCLDGRHRDL